jgi:hypothetical protein
MKEKELRKLATCGVCHKKIGNSGFPMFWKITVERFGLDAKALERQQGLGMMIGGTLAQVMGSDDEMTIDLMEPKVISVCETCAGKPISVYQLAED